MPNASDRKPNYTLEQVIAEMESWSPEPEVVKRWIKALRELYVAGKVPNPESERKIAYSRGVADGREQVQMEMVKALGLKK